MFKGITGDFLHGIIVFRAIFSTLGVSGVFEKYSVVSEGLWAFQGFQVAFVGYAGYYRTVTFLFDYIV